MRRFAAELLARECGCWASDDVAAGEMLPSAIDRFRRESTRTARHVQAALLHEVALALGGRAPEPEEVAAWVDWAADIDREITAASAAVRAIRADLRGRWGLGRAQHHAIGYWRRGRAMAPAG